MKHIKKNLLLYIFYFFFLLFMMHRVFFSSQGMIERVASSIVYPFLKIRQVVQYPFVQTILYFQSVSDLQQQVQSLYIKNENLQAELAKQYSLQKFDEQTKEIIEFSHRYHEKNKLLSQVLFFTKGDEEDSLLIDVGITKNIQKDDVVVYKNMIVGRVITVYPHYSKVALITDKRCKISAEQKKGITGICCGKNNGQLELNFVPHFKEVAIDSFVFSSGKGLMYPKGFLLGKVKTVTSDNVSHFIELQPLFDIEKLEYVYVFCKS